MDQEKSMLPDETLKVYQRHSTDKFGNTIIDLRGQHLQMKPIKIFSTGAFSKQHSLEKNDGKLSIFNKTTKNMRVVQEEESATANSRSSKAQPTVLSSHQKMEPIFIAQCRRPSQNSQSFGNKNTSFVIEGESLHHATAGYTNVLSKRYSVQ